MARAPVRRSSRGETLGTTFQVLDVADPLQRAVWERRWQQWPEREVMAHPDYAALLARPGDRVLCASTTTGSGIVLYPLILRPLSAEPWVTPDERSWDVTTPYGYGGPFAWSVNRDTADRFWDRFDDWATQHRVVSSFARLSLFGEQRLPFRGGEQDSAVNVVRNLDLSGGDLWMDYAHKVRKNVAKAQRAGLTVRFDMSGELLDSFLEIYTATLDRRGAARTYYFSRALIQQLIQRLAGQFLFCHVYRGTRVVSTELVLLSPGRMYSFLGGTALEAFEDRPNDLLKHALIHWGMEHGKRDYVLGGGYHAEDGILRYKQSFAPRGLVTFRVGKRVYDAAAYSRLVEQRRNWELSQAGTWNPQPDYFPLYRAPLIG